MTWIAWPPSAEANGRCSGDLLLEYRLALWQNSTGAEKRQGLLCKRKDAERCKCFWKDDLSPLLDRVFAADVLLIGSPIYLGDAISRFHAFVERLHFCTLSYDDYSNYFTGKVKVGVIFAMNAPQAYYQLQYRKKLTEQANAFRSLGGKVQTLAGQGLQQVQHGGLQRRAQEGPP